MRFYEALDLSPALALDAADLQKRFYDKSRQWHPDRYSRAGEEALRVALENSSVVNDAFRTLKDPVSRAEYFLEENGLGPAKSAPPELLEEVFELNMALDELRSGDESMRPQLEEARTRFLAMRSDIDQSLTASFGRYDSTRDAAVLKEIRSALDRRRYVSNLVRDVNKELEPPAA